MLVPNLTTNVEYELYTQVSLKLAWPFYEIQEIYLHFILSLDINSDVSSSSKSSYDTLIFQALTSSLYREDLVYPGKVSETHTLTVNRSIYDDDNVHGLVDGDDDENNDGFIFFFLEQELWQHLGESNEGGGTEGQCNGEHPPPPASS